MNSKIANNTTLFRLKMETSVLQEMVLYAKKSPV